MLTVGIFLSAVVAISSASICCTPDQWEGGQGSIIGYSGYKYSGLIKEYLSISYDAEGERVAAHLYYHNGDVNANYQFLMRYEDDTNREKGTLYVVDEKRDVCIKKHLNKPFHRVCIPDGAKHVGDASLGLKGGLDVSTYEFDGKEYMVQFSVSKLGESPNGEAQCVPISETIAKHGRFNTLRESGFVNITPGIKNETVFALPKLCADAYVDQASILADELTQDYFIMSIF